MVRSLGEHIGNRRYSLEFPGDQRCRAGVDRDQGLEYLIRMIESMLRTCSPDKPDYREAAGDSTPNWFNRKVYCSAVSR